MKKLLIAIDSFYNFTKFADAEAELAKAMIKFLAEVAKEEGIDSHSYIVGGSVRDYLMGVDPKDIDIVVETVKDPETGDVKNAVTLAKAVAEKLGIKNVQADQYGVVHVGPVPHDFMYEGFNFKGQKIEIVTARKEKYDKGAGKASHKPTAVEPGTIEDDLKRRDFRFNTLTWKLSDLANGLEGAPINDILGGVKDIESKLVQTPLDPDETFSEDPSRMLRAVRFAVKYGFELSPEVKDSISRLAEEVKRMPWEPVADVFVNKILKLGPDKAKQAIIMMDELNLLKPTLEMADKSFMQRQLKNMVVGKDADFIMFFVEYLNKYGIDNFIYRFPRKFEGKLVMAHEQLPKQDFQKLYDRLIDTGSIIDTNFFIDKYSMVGKEIGKLNDLAKEFIIDNPTISREELKEMIINHLENL